MYQTYNAFIDRMIQKYEGPYGWNKKDAGGPTKYGITCFDLAQHRHQKMTSMAAWAPIVQAMTLQEAEDIYAQKYAVGISYNMLPAGVDACMMDYAVNSGVSRAVLVARRLCGLNPGNMDASLIAAIEIMGAAVFIPKMCAERLAFMRSIEGGTKWVEFGHGWKNRVDDLEAYCLNLASRAPTASNAGPDLAHVNTPKAINLPTNAAPVTGGSAIAAAGAGYAAGLPWWAIVGAVLGVCVVGIIYEAHQERQTTIANNTIHA